MKKLAALLLFSGSVLANPTQQQQIDMILSMMDSSGALVTLAECTGLPQQKLSNVLRQSLSECGLGDMHAEEQDPAYEACMKRTMVRHSGIAAERWQECGDDADEPEHDPLLAELEALYERIGDREPTAAEQQQMDELIARMQQRGIDDMQQMVDGMIAGSQHTEALITLPLYPQAQLLINMPAQGEIEVSGKTYQTLPGASFISTDSPQQVLQYYRQQLPDYQLHRPSMADTDEAALLQHLPAGFDYSRDTAQAFSIPHVYIQPASVAAQQRLAGAKTLFFLYYPAAN